MEEEELQRTFPCSKQRCPLFLTRIVKLSTADTIKELIYARDKDTPAVQAVVKVIVADRLCVNRAIDGTCMALSVLAKDIAQLNTTASLHE